MVFFIANQRTSSAWNCVVAALVTRGQRRVCRGFTLIELLTVTVIIAILGAVTVGIFKLAQKRAAINNCRTDMQLIIAGIETFKLDRGFYPTSTLARVGGTLGNFPDSVNISNNWLLYQQLVLGTPTPYVRFKSAQLISPGRYSIGSITNYVYAGSTVIYDPFFVPYGFFNPAGVSAFAKSNTVSYDFWSWGPTANINALNADSIVNWGRDQ